MDLAGFVVVFTDGCDFCEGAFLSSTEFATSSGGAAVDDASDSLTIAKELVFFCLGAASP